MKKILALLLALMLILSLSLVACDEALADDDESKSSENVSGEKDKDDDQEIAEEDKVDFDKEDEDEEDDFVIEFYPGSEEDVSDDFDKGDATAVPDTDKGDATVGPATEGPATDKGDSDEELFDGMSPAEKYEQTFNEINLSTNLTMITSQDIQMVMTYQGQTVEQDMVQVITQKYAGDNFSIVGEAESAGQRVPSTNCQYIDGTVYNVQVTDGMKIKYQATKDQLESLAGVDTNEPKLFDIPESWFKNVEFKEDAEDNRVYLEILLSGEQYKQMFSNLALLSSVKEITDIVHKIYFTESGDLDSIVTTAIMKMDISGIDTTASFVSTSTISNVGTTVVEAPADANTYTLVDVSMLG